MSDHADINSNHLLLNLSTNQHELVITLQEHSPGLSPRNITSSSIKLKDLAEALGPLLADFFASKAAEPDIHASQSSPLVEPTPPPSFLMSEWGKVRGRPYKFFKELF